MSYSIIFETKIVRLSDGRIIHFDRSGCNNDNCGRNKDEFKGKIYTEKDFINKAEKYMENSKPFKESGEFELKIGSRYATMYDYGEHLLRMLNRAERYNEFIKNRYVKCFYCEKIEITSPEYLIMPLEEFDFYNMLKKYNTFSYRRIMKYPDLENEKEIITLISDGKYLNFYIGGKHL